MYIKVLQNDCEFIQFKKSAFKLALSLTLLDEGTRECLAKVP